MHYVYVLKSGKSGNLYIGCTSDLRRRFFEHNTDKARYTKNRGPYELIYYEAYKTKDDAFAREKNLKLRANALTGLKRRIVKSLV